MKNAQVRLLKPEYRLSVEADELQAVLRSELSDWLALEWFYPEDFRLERLSETADQLIASGETVEYLFPKATQNSKKRSVAQRWRQLCELTSLNASLAPDRFLGVRALKWVDGELCWGERLYSIPLGELEEDADELVLIARRIPDGARLSDVLCDEGELSHLHLDQLTSSVVRFHREEMRTTASHYSSSHISTSIFDPLSEFISEYGPYLDPYSLFAVKEIERYLTQEFAAQELVLRRRAKEGYVIYAHGALRSSNILLNPFKTADSELLIVGRNGRLQDVLADLAALHVDLELYDAEYLAGEISKRYAAELPEVFDERAFRFFRVAEGLRAAIEAFSDTGADKTLRANRALGVALRASLRYPEHSLVVICGSAVGESQALAEAFAELFAVPLLSAEGIRDGIVPGALSEQTLFDRFTQWCERLVQERAAVVAHWLGETSALTEDRYQQLKQWLAGLGVSYRIVRCDELELFEEVDQTEALEQHSQVALALEIARHISQTRRQVTGV